jgi:hypothetical protein
MMKLTLKNRKYAGPMILIGFNVMVKGERQKAKGKPSSRAFHAHVVGANLCVRPATRRDAEMKRRQFQAFTFINALDWAMTSIAPTRNTTRNTLCFFRTHRGGSRTRPATRVQWQLQTNQLESRATGRVYA